MDATRSPALRSAATLRRVAAGEPVNEAPDRPNIIEEIDSVASEQLHAVTSNLLQALIDLLKVEAWPHSAQVPHWESEAGVFRAIAADRYAASMRQRIDLATIYSKALRLLPKSIDGQPPLPVGQTCPLTLDDLLSDD